MSYAFAGALQGIGGQMMKIADEKRRMAEDLLKMERQAQLDIQVSDAKAQNRRGGSGGSGGRSRGGSGSSAGTFSNSDEVRLRETYNATFGDDSGYSGTPPSLVEFKGRVRSLMDEDRSLSRFDAERMAISQWTPEDVTTTTKKPRSMLSPARLWDDDGMYEETSTVTNYGFRDAMSGRGPTSAPASQGSSAAATADQSEALAQAKAAISRGADRDAVIARLKEMGIEPEGL